MNQVFLLVLLFLLVSCVEEIPLDELEAESFVNRDIASTNDQPDTEQPLIVFQAIENTSQTTADIHWKTNEPATGYIKYGTSQNLLNSSDKSLEFKNEYRITLNNLKEDTLYYYKIFSEDRSGNELVTNLNSFRTQAVIDMTPPTLSNISPYGFLDAGTKNIQITFSTDESATCRLSTDKTKSYNEMSLMDETQSSSHIHNIESLQYNEQYFYFIICQDQSGNQSSQYSTNFTIQELITDGVKLYEVNCMSCHNPLSNSTKKNRTANQIDNAIKNNNSMKAIPSLLKLSLTQIQQISNVLALQTESPAPSEEYADENPSNQQYIIGTRRYITSKFLQIFYEQDKDDSTKNIINKNIFENQNGTFGGICSLSESDCKGDSRNRTEGTMLPNSQPLRSAIIHNTCQEVLARDKAVNSALILAGLQPTDDGSIDENISKIFDVFYPGIEMNGDVVANLKNLYSESKNNGLSDIDAWKLVMNPMCKSALFEMF